MDTYASGNRDSICGKHQSISISTKYDFHTAIIAICLCGRVPVRILTSLFPSVMSSRQPTPGPSLINNAQKRRAVSETGPGSDTEALDSTRDAKKLKVDSTTTKDKKKKRRRKQKKTSVVVMSPSRTRSLSRSVAPVPSFTVSTQSVNAPATFVVSDMEDTGPIADDPAPTVRLTFAPLSTQLTRI